MARSSLRVYFVTHHDGRLTGHLMRWREKMFDGAPPTAYGASEEDVLRQLDVLLSEAIATDSDTLDRYLWTERFETREVRVSVHPQASVGKRRVIGKRQVPLRMTCAYSKLEHGGWRVMLPRFGWSFVLEDMEDAPDILKQSVSSALLGADSRWMFTFRREGAEYVLEHNSAPRDLDDRRRGMPSRDFPTLDAVAVDWVDRARRRELAAPVGDVQGAARLEKLVRRAAPESVLIVGPSGSGKTTLVRALARKLALAQREHEDFVPRLWSTSSDRIIAGMQYLGQWEERVLEMTRELSGEGDVLYVGHLGELLKERGAHSSIGQILWPELRAGGFALMAEATQEELALCARVAPSLVDSLRIVRVDEPEPERVPAFMAAYHARSGSDIEVHPQSWRHAARLLTFFDRARAFPGKACAFVDWMREDPDRVRTMWPADVSQAFSRYTGIPVDLISDEVSLPAEAIAQRLRSSVIGQPRACATSARVLARFKAGMNDPERPCGSLFFVGPTGVGKTELAKQLAIQLYGGEDRLIRVDMSEFQLAGSSRRLIATGRGVRSLVERLRAQPLCVLLLDEIEKAHAEVFDLLLGLLGEGRLTDDDGVLVDARMALVVMTSNVGAAARAPGFGGDEDASAGFSAAVRKHFRPEFFNRIDDVVPFDALSLPDIERIVDLSLAELAGRQGFKSRGVRIVARGEARARLAKLGYHPEFGARPLKRVIESRVVTPIAVALSAEPGLQNVTFEVRVAGEGVEVAQA